MQPPARGTTRRPSPFGVGVKDIHGNDGSTASDRRVQSRIVLKPKIQAKPYNTRFHRLDQSAADFGRGQVPSQNTHVPSNRTTPRVCALIVMLGGISLRHPVEEPDVFTRSSRENASTGGTVQGYPRYRGYR